MEPMNISAHVRGRSSSRSPQNQENRAEASDSVWKVSEDWDFYHDAKTVGFAILGELTFANLPGRSRLQFFCGETIRRHLEDLIPVECNSVRRWVWADLISAPRGEGQESTGGETSRSTTESTESGSKRGCFLLSHRSCSIMHHPTMWLVRIQPSEKLLIPLAY